MRGFVLVYGYKVGVLGFVEYGDLWFIFNMIIRKLEEISGI